MNSREQRLATLMIGLIAVAAIGAGGYFFVFQPLARANSESQVLASDISDLEQKLESQRLVAKRLAQARAHSLPADKDLAEREYSVALERLCDEAGVPKGHTIVPKTGESNSSRGVPEISKGKPIYTRVVCQVTLKKVNAWMLMDFLEGYYRLGVLHQITSFQIKKEDDPGGKHGDRRDDLTVTLITEAIIVDGAENRRTLLPVPTAFAAVGGGAIYKGMTISPDVARAVHWPLPTPVLSTSNRDYRLIVRKDPFSGPLPVTSTSPFKLARLSDRKVRTGEQPSPIHVSATGEGSNGAKFAASVSGSLFPEGALKFDPEEYAFDLPTPTATEGTATVTVTATSADGTITDKGTFKITVSEGSKSAKSSDDVSPFVILIGTTQGSDGSAWALIYDNANRQRYNLEANIKGVSVMKEELVKEKKARNWEWKVDDGYKNKHPAGVLHISDAATKTERTLKVVAVDFTGLIVAEIKGKEDGERPGKGAGRPQMGGGRPGARQGHGDPLAAIAGNMAMLIAPPKPNKPTKLYRWEVGQSLAKLKEIPEEEAQKILKAVESTGPVFDVAATDR